jgi:hypothetical protein
MRAHEVYSDQWDDCLSRFSRIYRGKQMTLDTVGGAVGAACAARDVPLGAVGLMGDAEGVPQLMVRAGRPTLPQAVFHILRPVRLWLSEGGRSAAAELQVRAADGSLTLLRIDRDHAEGESNWADRMPHFQRQEAMV